MRDSPLSVVGQSNFPYFIAVLGAFGPGTLAVTLLTYVYDTSTASPWSHHSRVRWWRRIRSTLAERSLRSIGITLATADLAGGEYPGMAPKE